MYPLMANLDLDAARGVLELGKLREIEDVFVGERRGWGIERFFSRR